MSTARKAPIPRVADLCTALEEIAPTGLAQSWDNVGLIVGDRSDRVRRVLLCIDLTPEVAAEAIRRKTDFVLAYHPPIFKPITRLTVPSRGTEDAVYRCIRRGIAVYSVHTALDAADGGTNDVLVSMMGIKQTQPFEHVPEPGRQECKVVVFVPPDEADRVAAAMFDAGAGHIGNYRRCSFRLRGEGTFFGEAPARPTIGKAGRLEVVDEIRLECVTEKRSLAAVIRAMIEAHSYEQPAYDIYPLTPPPVRGIGRIGPLPRPTTLGSLAKRLKKRIPAGAVQIVGDSNQIIERAAILVGAAGSMPLGLGLGEGDVVVTGEIRHHDALSYKRAGIAAIALGHWSSERPVLDALANRLKSAVQGIETHLSTTDTDPFTPP